jgi:oxygen-dependent protoporphyrinogen oxidase
MTYDVAIIGAGVSGLTAAYDLQRAGLKVVVLERQQHIGGNAISERFDGFLMEHGPTTLNALVPDASQLACELALDRERIELGNGVCKRYLRDGQKLHGVSIHPAGFLTSSYLSFAARLRVMGEMFASLDSGHEDETVYQFAVRRFGREFAEKVMDPLVAGMFAGDARKLSMISVLPKLVKLEAEHGSVTRGVLAAKRGSEPAKRLFSFRNGVGALPLALAGKLADKIQTGVTVKSIKRRLEDYSIDIHAHGRMHARHVILAVQPHVAAHLLENVDEVSATAAAAIVAPPLSVVFMAYGRQQVDHKLDSLGFLSVRNRQSIITGAQFLSTMFEGRAPNGFVTIAAYVGGARNPAAGLMNRNDIVNQVHQELSDLLQIKGTPVVARVRQWARSLPQYEVGHREKIAVLTTINERSQGLFVTGNYLGGVSIANCIAQARETADQLVEGLEGKNSCGCQKLNVG